nr:acylphosphatase [Cellulomonas humilata]
MIVRGHVQGVGYRWSLAREARRLGVHGWARNRADGTVEAVLEGAAADVEVLVEWCRTGPGGAGVSGLVVTVEEPEGLTKFEIRA